MKQTRRRNKTVHLLIKPLRIIQHDEMPRAGHHDPAILELRILFAEAALDFIPSGIVLIGNPGAQHQRGGLDAANVAAQIMAEEVVHRIRGGRWIRGLNPGQDAIIIGRLRYHGLHCCCGLLHKLVARNRHAGARGFSHRFGGFHRGIGHETRRQKGKGVHNNDRPRQVWIMRREPESDKTPEAVADDDRMVELLVANIGREIIPDGLEERRRNAGLAREARERQDMALIAVLQMLNGPVPNSPRARQPRNQNDRLAVAGDLDGKGPFAARMSEASSKGES